MFKSVAPKEVHMSNIVDDFCCQRTIHCVRRRQHALFRRSAQCAFWLSNIVRMRFVMCCSLALLFVDYVRISLSMRKVTVAAYVLVSTMPALLACVGVVSEVASS